MGFSSGEAARAAATRKAIARKAKAKPKRRPAPAPKRYSPPAHSRTDAQQGGYPGSPIREVRQRNNKPVVTQHGARKGKYSVRTFKNADYYKAYDARLQAKKLARQGVRARARRDAIVDTATLTPAGKAARHALAEQLRTETRSAGKAKTERVQAAKRPITGQESAAERSRQERRLHHVQRVTHQRLADIPKIAKTRVVADHRTGVTKGQVRLAPRPERERAVKRAVREAEHATSPAVDAVGRELKRMQDADLKAGLPPRGTSVERGVLAGRAKREEAQKRVVLKRAKVARRKGGVGTWAKNALDEARDAVTSAPAQAVQLASAAAGSAIDVGQAAEHKTGRRRVVETKGKNLAAYAESQKRGYLDSSVVVPLVKGDLKEALGRLKERPLSGAAEFIPAGAVAGKGLRGASVVAKVGREHRKIEDRRPAGPMVRLKPEHSFRHDVAEEAARRAANRRKRVPLHAGPVKVHRRYSGSTAVRAVQKGKDITIRRLGGDPGKASTRGGRISKHARVTRRRTDEGLRNVQHGGQAREERTAAAVLGAHKQGKAKHSRKRRATQELMTRNPVLRDDDHTKVIAELERIRAFHADGGRAENVRIIDKILAETRRKGADSYIMRESTREAADRLAEQAKRSDAEEVKRGFVSKEAAEGTAARQGLIESGRIVLAGQYRPEKGGGGEGPTPSPPSATPPADRTPPRTPSQPKPVSPRMQGEGSPRATQRPTPDQPKPSSKVTIRHVEPDPEAQKRAAQAGNRRHLDEAERKVRELNEHPDVVAWHQAFNAIDELERKIKARRAEGDKSDSPMLMEAQLGFARKEHAKAGESEAVQKWRTAVRRARDLKREVESGVSEDVDIAGSLRAAKEEHAGHVARRKSFEDVAAVRTYKKYRNAVVRHGKKLNELRQAYKGSSPERRKELEAEAAEVKTELAKAKTKMAEHAERPEVRRFREAELAEAQGERKVADHPRPKSSGPAMDVDEVMVPRVRESESERRSKVRARQRAKQPVEAGKPVVEDQPRPEPKSDYQQSIVSEQAERKSELADLHRERERLVEQAQGKKGAELKAALGDIDQLSAEIRGSEQAESAARVRTQKVKPSDPSVTVVERPPPAAADVADVVADAATGEHRYVWAHNGEEVTNEAAIKANPRGAFLRGARLQTDEMNLLLGTPRAGTGYSPQDLLTTRLGERQLDAELEKSRRSGLARLTEHVQESYALRDKNGNVEVFETTEGAQRAAHEASRTSGVDYVPHAFFDKGEQFMLLPREVDRRVRKQLEPAGRTERLGRYLTRQAIRATLPLSVLWHAGNVADLSLRVALTTSPRDWVTRGPEMARLLEQHMDELDPDLRDELLATLKGHFGSRRTVRDPRLTDVLYNPSSGEYAFPTLASVSNRIGDVVKSLPPTKVIDKAFDLTSAAEGRIIKRVVGAEARNMARELGHHINDASQMMEALARDLVDDPAKLHALQQRVLEVVGDFSTRAPWERKILRGIDPYWKWLKAANKFVFLTLPERHPVKVAMLLQGTNMSADERTRMGLNYYWSDEEYADLAARLGSPGRSIEDRGEGYTAGALRSDEGGIIPMTPFTSFGEASSLLSHPESLAGRPLSYLTRPLTAAGAFNPALKAAGAKKVKGGYYRTPGELALKGLPGGGEISDLRIKQGGPDAKLKRALQLASEGAIPGAKQARQVGEGGTRPLVYSTAIHPRSDPKGAGGEPKSLRGGLDKVLNPLHAQRLMPPPASDAQPAVAGVGEFFQVRQRNLDGTWTVFWAKREH